MSAKVVVFVTAELRTDATTDPDVEYVIGRLRQLGLHAHGKNRDEAIANLKSHFRHYVESLRATGELESRLDAAGVRWLPHDEARRQNIPYEDLRPDRLTAEQTTSERFAVHSLVRAGQFALAAAA